MIQKEINSLLMMGAGLKKASDIASSKELNAAQKEQSFLGKQTLMQEKIQGQQIKNQIQQHKLGEMTSLSERRKALTKSKNIENEMRQIALENMKNLGNNKVQQRREARTPDNKKRYSRVQNNYQLNKKVEAVEKGMATE